MTQSFNLNTTVNPIEDKSNPENIFFKISYNLIGIKKRCRKSDRHFVQLGSIPYNNGSYDLEDIKSKVQASIAENFKQIDSTHISIHLDHVIITHELGMTCTQWEPFSALNVKFQLPVV